MSQLTLEGETIEILPANPKKDLSPAELKLYNYLLRMGPKTEIEIRRNPAFDNVADIGRALRRMRSRTDANGRKDPYVDSVEMRKGPIKWMVIKWPARRSK